MFIAKFLQGGLLAIFLVFGVARSGRAVLSRNACMWTNDVSS